MKLVKEHINEKFIEDSDPIEDLNIGVKTLIHNWINYLKTTRGPGFAPTLNGIGHYTINSDGAIDVGPPMTHKQGLEIADNIYAVGDEITIRGEEIKKLPKFINFNNCYGNCYINVSAITSLRGCPRKVFGSFCINANPNLKTLKFFPIVVYGNVYLDDKFSISQVTRRCQVYGEIKTLKS